MKNNKNNVNRFLMFALLASLCYNYYQWSCLRNERTAYGIKVNSLVASRNDVEKTLTDTYSELNQYKGINTRLDSLLIEANIKLDEQRTKIDNLLIKERNNKEYIQELQAEL